MSVRIPEGDPQFTGVINELATESMPSRSTIKNPPVGAPNVVLVMLDDVGFGATGTFGGPIPTPTLDRIAAEGVSYNQFRMEAGRDAALRGNH